MKTKMRPRTSNRGMSSVWSNVVRDRHGRIKHVGEEHSNIRVDSGDDWQAIAMAGTVGNANIFATASGAATSVTANSLTNTGAAFPTTAVVTGATGGLAGQIVSVGPNAAGAGTTVYGVIISNTATVLSVDRWVTAASPFAVATTPNGTATYQIVQNMAPAWYIGTTETAVTPAAGDVVLSTELTVDGFARANATSITHTITSATYSLSKTFTATNTRTIRAGAVFVASGAQGVTTAALGGPMVFEHAEPSPPTLVSGDTLQQNVQVSY